MPAALWIGGGILLVIIIALVITVAVLAEKRKSADTSVSLTPAPVTPIPIADSDLSSVYIPLQTPAVSTPAPVSMAVSSPTLIAPAQGSVSLGVDMSEVQTRAPREQQMRRRGGWSTATPAPSVAQ